MVGPCPYNCENKTSFGYCKTTACINPKYLQIIFWSSNNNAIPISCVGCPNHPAYGGTGICNCILGNSTIY